MNKTNTTRTEDERLAWNAYQRKYYAEHKERMRITDKKYYEKNRSILIEKSTRSRHKYDDKIRQTTIRHDGKIVFRDVQKNPFPEGSICPFCGNKTYLNWHHWDDSNPSDGTWTCFPCHQYLHRLILKKPLPKEERANFLAKYKENRTSRRIERCSQRELYLMFLKG